MNHITRPPLSTTDDAASATRTKPTVQSLPRLVADLRGTANDPGVRLPRRTLDRLNSAATLGLIFVAPRSALLVARVLGPRILPSTSTSVGQASPATRRQEVS
jgi:hypothetical protein